MTMDDTLTPPAPADAGLAERVEQITAMARMADLCGHADRPGNIHGYCDACWSLFREQQGLGHDESIQWDRMQEALVELMEDPAKRTAVLTRRIQALRANLALNLPFYAKAHAQATTVAAGRGDARPAEWALTNIAVAGERVVEPPKAKDTTSSDRVQVIIGVNVGGLPTGQVTVDGRVVE